MRATLLRDVLGLVQKDQYIRVYNEDDEIMFKGYYNTFEYRYSTERIDNISEGYEVDYIESSVSPKSEGKTTLDIYCQPY